MRPGFDLTFMWPDLLWLLVVLPLGLVGYVVARRFERIRLLNILCVTLTVVGLASVLIASARPKIQIPLPTRAEKLMVVLDISGSMRADDVKPDRFTMAKDTVKQIIAEQPPSMRVGLVTTAASASLVQAPTTDRDALLAALDAVNLQTGSALGSGLLIGLSELLPSAGINVQALMNDSLRRDPLAESSWQPDPALARPAGSNRNVAMVLISDGESNIGPNVEQMAALAAHYGVRVHTIGIGTPQGAVVKAQGISQRVRLEPGTLSDIATITAGRYYEGASSEDLQQIYQAIEASIAFDRRQTLEISAWLLLLGMGLIVLGMGATFARQGRLI